MARDENWIEIPLVLNEDDFVWVVQHLDRFGIRFKSKVRAAGHEAGGYRSLKTYKNRTVLVTEAQAGAAALVFRNCMDIDDPATLEPFSGPCPACGEQVDGAYACPSCEISFGGSHDEDSPIVQFIRQHGGFAEGGGFSEP